MKRISARTMRKSWRVRCCLLALAIALASCNGAATSSFDDAGLDAPAPNSDSASPLVDAGRDWPDPNDQPPWDAETAGRLLGATLYGPERVEFSIFAPNASSVAVTGDFGEYELSRDPSGVWAAMVAVRDPVGKGYAFVIDSSRTVFDPYAKAARQHRGGSVIVDASYPWTDTSWRRPKRSELVVYEMHVSDFTFDESSGVSADKRGRYAGAIERIDHLVRLGVNAVELMPVSESQSNAYGWGYNPAFLFAPEAGYASSIDGVQVKELQSLVDALHGAGIAVIIDVVYNHMWGEEADNPLYAVDPPYYFDFDGDGDIEDDRTPWGYKLATQRPMVRKLVYDNMRFWMDSYHVDGFRMDSTENVDFLAIERSVAALDSQGYGDRYFILEEFNAGHNTRLRAFNANAGKTLLSSWGTSYKNDVWSTLADGSCDCASLGEATFFSSALGWNAADEVVNYVSSHDEGTLAARVDSDPAMIRLAATHVLTSLGVPMIWMGDEFMRVHYGNNNPQGSGVGLSRAGNLLDWRLADTHADLVDFLAALIRLRVSHAALQSRDGRELRWSTVSWKGAIGYAYAGIAGDNDFVVLINYTLAEQTYSVRFPRAGLWHLMSDGVRALSVRPGIEQWTVSSTPRAVVVPARRALVLMSDAVNR